jgi:hypothetical protein
VPVSKCPSRGILILEYDAGTDHQLLLLAHTIHIHLIRLGVAINNLTSNDEDIIVVEIVYIRRRWRLGRRRAG